jgi:hypothetical protein
VSTDRAAEQDRHICSHWTVNPKDKQDLKHYQNSEHYTVDDLDDVLPYMVNWLKSRVA